jgi:hypothetical protein
MTTGDRMGFNCVVDASVGIKLFLIEPLSDRTDALFAHLVDDPPSQFYVPDLFSIECTNILWKYVRRFGYPADAAKQDVAHLTKLFGPEAPAFRCGEEGLLLPANIGSSPLHWFSSPDILRVCEQTFDERATAISLILADTMLFGAPSTDALYW